MGVHDAAAMFEITPEVLGAAATVYGVGAAGAALLQARQILRRRMSCDVSAKFFASYAGGYAIWLLYGLSIDSLPLILVDAIGFVCGAITLAVTLALRGSLVRPTTWSSCELPSD
jgi:uncharacterized protein with PQ loop repeat